jgi:hypothetical protein
MLSENYPNPFTYSTTIEYVLPQNGHVRLNIYNAVGEQVATVVNGEESGGKHIAGFSGDGLQNGIYFYRLIAGNYSRTGTMTIMR